MSWICPHCGTRNYREPLNSRDDPPCRGCGEPYTTPEELQAQIPRKIEDAKAALKEAQARANHAGDHIASLRDELATWEIQRKAALEDVENEKAELAKLENFKIYCEENRDARARLDIHQKTLPFEVPA